MILLFRFLLRFLKPYRMPVAFVLVLVFLQSLANLYLPTLMADIVDTGIVKSDTTYILHVGGIMLLVTLGGTICAIIASFFSAKVAIGFGRLIRVKLFTHVENFSLHEFDTVGTASLITRTTNDTTQVQQVLIIILNMMISAPLMAIGGIILAIEQDATGKRKRGKEQWGAGEACRVVLHGANRRFCSNAPLAAPHGRWVRQRGGSSNSRGHR